MSKHFPENNTFELIANIAIGDVPEAGMKHLMNALQDFLIDEVEAIGGYMGGGFSYREVIEEQGKDNEI